MDPETIIPFLKQHLNYRARDSTGTVIPLETLGPSFTVFVVGRTVLEPARGDQFPVVGGWLVYSEATEGKIGGVGEGEITL